MSYISARSCIIVEHSRLKTCTLPASMGFVTGPTVCSEHARGHLPTLELNKGAHKKQNEQTKCDANESKHVLQLVFPFRVQRQVQK